MRIDPAYPDSVKMVPINRCHYLSMLRDWRPRQSGQQVQDLHPVPECTQGKFPDDEWVDKHLIVVQQYRQTSVLVPQMVYPN